MGIKIITDSTSDIDMSRQEELGIEILPLAVSFGEEEFIDGVTITNDEFYEKLRICEKLPTTTQVNPERFVSAFEKYKKTGDTVIAILVSSKLSGTYQSAMIAKNMCEADNVYIIDSKKVTLALAAIVFEAVRLRDKGLSAEEIYEGTLKAVEKLEFYAMVDTLKYLKMGGRLSASAAAVGTMLNIKPIIAIKDGEIVVASRTRGKKAAFDFMASKIIEKKPDKNSLVFGSSNNPELRREFVEFIKGTADFEKHEEINLGSVVGTHGGPNCIGFAYLPE